jgi:hypothetical protein
MKHRILLALTLPVFLVNSYSAGDEKKGSEPPKDPYAELFSVPSKVTLDDAQKEKLAELRKQYESGISIAMLDKKLALPGVIGQDRIWTQEHRDRLARQVVRKKNAILTEEQRTTLGVKLLIPSIAQEKALNDDKVWDLSQLEKDFTIESRSFDPVEQVVSFMVITKGKWTESERKIDAANWEVTLPIKKDSPVQVIFYNKKEETSYVLTKTTLAYGGVDPHDSTKPLCAIMRAPTKLTDKQAEEGLLRFRIAIDMDMEVGLGKDVTGAKFVCPPLK